MPDRVIVVGGGPAGLMAAGRAAELGAEALLIEKTPRLGNKLRLTGGGHGNITHAGSAEMISAHLGPTGAALLPAIERLCPLDLIAFFRAHEVPITIDPDGRVFPAARNAHILATALRRWCLLQGVTFRYRSQVDRVDVNDGRVTGVRIGDLTIGGGAVVLATGGLSFPSTGSTGDGYALAASLGHHIVPPAAGLVPLVASDPWVSGLAGVTLREVVLSAEQADRATTSVRGDVLFTSFGLSGPAALDTSSLVSRWFERGAVTLKIDCVPELSMSRLDVALTEAYSSGGRAEPAAALQTWLPAALAAVVVRLASVSARHAAELSAADRRRIIHTLKGLPLHLVGTRPLQEGMVTLGGLDTAEMDGATLASRLVEGLYIAGELLDVAGDTGGYNLQAAFATGWVAGESAAVYVSGAGA